MLPFGRRKIKIKYLNGETDEITPILLNTYIETGQISGFERREGWVEIGRDPIRGTDGSFQGEERRRH